MCRTRSNHTPRQFGQQRRKHTLQQEIWSSPPCVTISLILQGFCGCGQCGHRQPPMPYNLRVYVSMPFQFCPPSRAQPFPTGKHGQSGDQEQGANPGSPPLAVPLRTNSSTHAPYVDATVKTAAGVATEKQGSSPADTCHIPSVTARYGITHSVFFWRFVLHFRWVWPRVPHWSRPRLSGIQHHETPPRPSSAVSPCAPQPVLHPMGRSAARTTAMGASATAASAPSFPRQTGTAHMVGACAYGTAPGTGNRVYPLALPPTHHMSITAAIRGPYRWAGLSWLRQADGAKPLQQAHPESNGHGSSLATDRGSSESKGLG